MKGAVIIKKVPATSLKLAEFIANVTSDMKAEDIVILDMRKVTNFCDYFVVCSGTSSRQVRSIADEIDDRMLELGYKIRYKQGFKEGLWALVDCGNVVAHVFSKATREFYGLEYLWQEAKKIKWNK